MLCFHAIFLYTRELADGHASVCGPSGVWPDLTFCEVAVIPSDALCLMPFQQDLVQCKAMRPGRDNHPAFVQVHNHDGEVRC